MHVTLPLLIEKFTHRDGSRKHRVRPLFLTAPEWLDTDLNRAIRHASDYLRAYLRELTAMNPRAVAHLSFDPEARGLQERTLNLDVHEGDLSYRGIALLVTWRVGGLRMGALADLPTSPFVYEKDEDPEERARAVLLRFIRRQKDLYQLPFAFSDEKRLLLFTSALELEVEERLHLPPREMKFSFLGQSEDFNGEEELHKVGRLLNAFYPDELPRAVGREEEVNELLSLLLGEDRRPILLVGPASVGKTAVIQEVTWRLEDFRLRRGKHLEEQSAKDQFSLSEEQLPILLRHRKKQVGIHLLAPDRIIAGMSYVGQWESRLEAILRYVEAKDQVLYIDHPLGLFYAGISAQSRHHVAALMKPWLEDRRFRLVAETTPEGLRRMQEIDRRFADLFHLLPIREPDTAGALSMMFEASLWLEQMHQTTTSKRLPLWLSQVFLLQQRFTRLEAFPGKGIRALQMLAPQEGLNPLSPLQMLPLSVHAGSRTRQWKKVVGQPEVVEAAEEVAQLLLARLNDPRRPLQVMFFAGPTGVGKTFTAKMMAEIFFGRDALLRFDMNEFGSAYAAARLVGTPDQPEGLLTSAVRRRPRAVVLLDEIEKAHPNVFTLLLQVMDEGRLTDALGQTADFSFTIIVMTSNLGTGSREGRLGFSGSRIPDALTLRREVESFFAPEFVNRIDRFIAFRPLEREHVRQIAAQEVKRIAARLAATGRRGVLSVSSLAWDRLVDLGFDKELGARALRRTLEQRLFADVGARLAVLPPEQLFFVEGQDIGGRLTFEVAVIPEAPRVLTHEPPTPGSEAIEESAESLLRHIREARLSLDPDGDLLLNVNNPQIKEKSGDPVARFMRQLMFLEEEARGVCDAVTLAITAAQPRYRDRGPRGRSTSHDWDTPAHVVRDVWHAPSLEELRPGVTHLERYEPLQEEVRQGLAERLHALEVRARSHLRGPRERALLVALPLTGELDPTIVGFMSIEVLTRAFFDTFQVESGWIQGEATAQEEAAWLLLEGAHAGAVARAEAGIHLVRTGEADEALLFLERTLSEGDSPQERAEALLKEVDRAARRRAAGEGDGADPRRLSPKVCQWEVSLEALEAGISRLERQGESLTLSIPLWTEDDYDHHAGVKEVLRLLRRHHTAVLSQALKVSQEAAYTPSDRPIRWPREEENGPSSEKAR